MLNLHIAHQNYSTWSLRSWVLMKALAIPFTETVHQFAAPNPESRGSFGDVSPTSRLPLLIADELQIWDTMAIAEFLAETYPQVWPADKGARAWARSASAEMHSSFATLRSECPMNISLRICLHSIKPALQSDIARIENLWTQGLERFKGPWLAGPTFTAVDAFFGPVAFRLQTYGIELVQPAQAYLQRLLQHPAMLAWQQQAIGQKVRDEPHEVKSQNSGKVTLDLRDTLNA